MGILLVAKTPSANLPIRKSRGRGAGEEGRGGEIVSSRVMQRGEATVLAAHKQSHRSRNTRWDPEWNGRHLNPTSGKPRGRLVVIWGL